MYKFGIIILVLCVSVGMTGCATVSDVSPKDILTEDNVQLPVVVAPRQEVKLSSENVEKLVDPVIEKGMIIVKTEFEGILKARYVEFLFVDQNNSEHQFQIHVENKVDENVFPWNVKMVNPGYFFLELPAGQYKILSVSIPVGSAVAVEKMDVDVQVRAAKVLYVGTLKMVGTKEKIRLGGLPVIKPGFEYEIEIINSHIEGIAKFREYYPNAVEDISVELMRVNMSKEDVIAQ
ncbi:hypothetical protein MNBD_BACTEROID05-156 [hydrothermal vent metagenome]|uniref:DUF4382 domain-containing protein n=1 Tax=hydrothermal vent metagenome TaxID=652676 RepID=A0A3B0TWK6_9ZZZZ